MTPLRELGMGDELTTRLLSVGIESVEDFLAVAREEGAIEAFQREMDLPQGLVEEMIARALKIAPVPKRKIVGFGAW